VPNLILQPIAENAIRHGIVACVGNGCIEIRAKVVDERLRLQVKDNGPGLDASEGDNRFKRGLGFALTRERLERLYGANQLFQITDVPEGGLQVTIEMPFAVSEFARSDQKAMAV
jgi:LytS/YehU family sensor histidine kinase